MSRIHGTASLHQDHPASLGKPAVARCFCGDQFHQLFGQDRIAKQVCQTRDGLASRSMRFMISDAVQATDATPRAPPNHFLTRPTSYRSTGLTELCAAHFPQVSPKCSKIRFTARRLSSMPKSARSRNCLHAGVVFQKSPYIAGRGAELA
jgi:hypothetical protein